MILRYAPNPERRSKIHEEIERRCGLSEDAAMLLVELDLFGELLIQLDEVMPALAELQVKGLAERRAAPLYACALAVAGPHVREIFNRIRAIGALEAELARAGSPEPTSEPLRKEDGDEASIPRRALEPELERAIVEDALALIDQNPMLPKASEARVYLRPGSRFVRVFWTYAESKENNGSLLHFVELATGRIYRRAGSSKKVPTSRFVGSRHA